MKKKFLIFSLAALATGLVYADQYLKGRGLTRVAKGGYSVTLTKAHTYEIDGSGISINVGAGEQWISIDIRKYEGAQKWKEASAEFTQAPDTAIFGQGVVGKKLTSTGDMEQVKINKLDCLRRTFEYEGSSTRQGVTETYKQKGVVILFQTRRGVYRLSVSDEPAKYDAVAAEAEKVIATLKGI